MKNIKQFDKFFESSSNDKTKNLILKTLKDNGGELENKELFDLCKVDFSDTMNVYAFYELLAELDNEGKIKENKDKTKIILI